MIDPQSHFASKPPNVGTESNGMDNLCYPYPIHPNTHNSDFGSLVADFGVGTSN